jgi:hypothetical protein
LALFFQFGFIVGVPTPQDFLCNPALVECTLYLKNKNK